VEEVAFGSRKSRNSDSRRKDLDHRIVGELGPSI
jgi:hypothetical protein